MNNDILIEAKNLKKYFKVKKGLLHAVDDINFQINKGETLGVVGESGCGKSTLGRTVIRLHEPSSGEVYFKNENIYDFDKKKMKLNRTNMNIIFQDPYSSLNPRMCVADLIADPIMENKLFSSKKEVYKRVEELMNIVGLAKRLELSYPHELDGGRRQRIGVARALAVNPEFIVCDEPVSALDVSIQAQILNLLMDLQENLGLTYMFITHDLSVVKHISNKIMVMYLGQCIEYCDSDEIFKNPLHPYTKALLDAIPEPSVNSKDKEFKLLQGEVISPINPIKGCRFATRCKYVTKECRERNIETIEYSKDHFVSCLNVYKINQ